MKKRRWYIYILKDPRTQEVRYVGWSYDVKKRICAHISTAPKTKSHKANWIKGLLFIGLNPIIEVVMFGNIEGGWKNAERVFIKHYKEKGCNLTNMTDGGEGTPGFFPSEETRKKMSTARIGRKQSPEAIAKTLAFLIGRKKSPEHIAKLSSIRKGKIPFAATIAAAKKNKGRHQSKEHVEKRISKITGKIRIERRKLTEEEVQYIRATTGIIPLRKIAKELGVGQTIIHEIRHYTAYRDVVN